MQYSIDPITQHLTKILDPMNILIIEDEPKCVRNLVRALDLAAVNYKLAGVVESVSDGVIFLSAPHEVDLIISDIQIHEGLSFEIFRHAEVKIPVIFCTAFDMYNLENSVSVCLQYILKPFTTEAIKNVVETALSCANMPAAKRNEKLYEYLDDVCKKLKAL